jgi:hypothetical protein
VKKGTKVFISELNRFIFDTIQIASEAEKLNVDSWIALASI